MAAGHSSRRQLPSTMTGRCRTTMARSPWPAARRWKPAGNVCGGRRRSGDSRRVGQVRLRGRGFPASHCGPGGGSPAARGHGHHQRPASFRGGGLSRSLAGVPAAGDCARDARPHGTTCRPNGRLRPQRPRQSGRRRSAQTELAVRKNALAQAAAQTNVASARLVELLHLEPTRVLVPQEPTIVPIELVSPDARVAQLVADGLSNRPELAQSRHLVEEAVRRLDREQYAPLLPSLLLDVSQSGYGGGPDSTVADFAGDLISTPPCIGNSATLAWGTPPPEKAARSRLEQSRQLQIQLMDRVAREIVEAHAQSESLRGQIAVAQSGIRVASESYRRNLERIRGGQGLPLEVLQSLQALDQSCREYLRAVGDYDEWQFRLYRALGCPDPAGSKPCEIGLRDLWRSRACFHPSPAAPIIWPARRWQPLRAPERSLGGCGH